MDGMDIVDRIDAVTGCHTCGGPLGGSVSDTFCGEPCQWAWHRSRAAAPPDDWPEFDAEAAEVLAAHMEAMVRFVDEGWAGLSEALQPLSDPRGRAFWLRQRRNTGPVVQSRAPRAINPRRAR